MKAVLILSLLDNSKTNIIMGNFYKLKLIKESVNSAIDLFEDGLESCKIL